jgi:uncharacterized protein
MEETITIPNIKGLQLAASLHRPDKEGRFPAVIVLPGFRGSKEEEHIKSLATALAQHDIVTIRFDASGWGDSEGTAENDYRLSNYFNDTESVYEYLKALPYVDTNHIGLFGHSMGAMLVVLFAAKHPEIKASVSVSPPYVMKTKNRVEHVWVGWKKSGYLEKEWHGKTVKIPWEFLDDAGKYNALKDVPKIKTPILFILGTADVNVVPDETKALYEKANEPKELFEVDGMDHFYKKDPEKLMTVFNKILEFYKKNL